MNYYIFNTTKDELGLNLNEMMILWGMYCDAITNVNRYASFTPRQYSEQTGISLNKCKYAINKLKYLKYIEKTNGSIVVLPHIIHFIYCKIKSAPNQLDNFRKYKHESGK